MKSVRALLRCVTLAGVAGLLAPLMMPRFAGAILAGDVNDDQVIDARDLAALTVRIFDAAFTGAPGADANGDRLISAADITFVVYAAAGQSPPPSATAGTPVATATNAPTALPTATPSVTSTPAPDACAPQVVQPGTIHGSLEPGDCANLASNGQPSDVYTVTASVGEAVSVQITATGFTPIVTVADAGVYFGQATAPVEFLVTTTRPYQIIVSSVGAATTGNYSLVVGARTCPTGAMAVTPVSGGETLKPALRADDCPDPFLPSTPAHRFAFAAQAGQPVEIDMVTDPNSTAVPDPFLTLYGPPESGDFTGYFLVSDADSGGAVGNGTTNASVYFLPIESGIYTVVANGAGRPGPYEITFSLPPCIATAAPVSSSPTQLSGTLSQTSCPAPPPLPAAVKTDADTRADLWTVDLDAGDVIAAKLISVDAFDPQLYLLGPDQTLLAADDDGSEDGGLDSQLAITAPQAGTYTIVAASNQSAVTRSGMSVRYQLDLQRCPARPLAFDSQTNASFAVSDCRGTDGAHFNSYRLDATGLAGQFVTVTMHATDDPTPLDPVLSLSGPNGVRSDNDDDPFQNTTDARVSTMLAQAGDYFVTATSFPSAGEVEAGFVLWAQRCQTIPISGTVAQGQFQDDDCSLFADGTTVGPKLNVFTLATAANQMLTVVPASVGCTLAVTADGLQGPGPKCLTNEFPMPLINPGTTAVMVVAPGSTNRGTYDFPVAVCPAQLVNYDSSDQSGTIVSSRCRDAAGIPSDAFIFRAPRDLTLFNTGFGGRFVATQFANGSLSADDSGVAPLSEMFFTSSDVLWPVGPDLFSGLIIRPTNTSGSGAYAIEITPPLLH